MERYLLMARRAVASHLPCRALQILLLREELFLGKLTFLMQLAICKYCIQFITYHFWW